MIGGWKVGTRRRPLVRWWWLSGPFRKPDIDRQLSWIRAQGFGGVELAWMLPQWLDETGDDRERPMWVGEEWRSLARYTKRRAREFGLQCDFTLGSSWPFGASWVREEDAAKTFSGLSPQRLRASWESAGDAGILVIDHLSATALANYTKPMLDALGDAALSSALFCDSLEIETDRLWSPVLWDEFETRFGYRLESFAESLAEHKDVRFDYRRLIAETMQREFFAAFTELCHERGAESRAQCHGAPVDLLEAYAAVDVPESEALLFPLRFSRIAASAAAWAGKRMVSAEAFTALHGFPGWGKGAEGLWKKEHAGDLKLLADALLAQGVNRIVWHGMPYRAAGKETEFYAAVHVGADSAFADQLASLNDYLASMCGLLGQGQSYGGIGVYLPFEAAWMKDQLPARLRTPGANYWWEMRHAEMPEELAGFQPLWISQAFLREAQVTADRGVRSRELYVSGLYVDCQWLDWASLVELERLASAKARIIWKRRTMQPGRILSADYRALQRSVRKQAVKDPGMPLVSGEDLPWFWARAAGDDLLLFFAHPWAKTIEYPMPHRFSDGACAIDKTVWLNWCGQQIEVRLRFGANESICLAVDSRGRWERVVTEPV